MARKSNKDIGEAIIQLQDLFKSREHLKYTEKDLALLVGMTEKTVRKHLTNIKRDTGSRVIEAITRDFLDDFDMIMGEVKKQMKKALKTDDQKKILYLSNQLTKNWNIYSDLLQKFGILQPVVQNINLQADITQRSLSIEVVADARTIAEDTN